MREYTLSLSNGGRKKEREKIEKRGKRIGRESESERERERKRKREREKLERR